ncbi:uncharacterized protein B0H18DRAFT_646188 [Fomitopsis serialis]|uniref:uncharacterized protein n=1 Tax=Fomitopsis serialis TaxID=139415 RepID=UPI002008BC95|nr:uncharacterized protein B0H18DRAFT_646188 [Neoantrodia serialis]KAH9933461.1 hypothetical protein B0H18DRAFT_646188 [Neoantrodia serialis]
MLCPPSRWKRSDLRTLLSLRARRGVYQSGISDCFVFDVDPQAPKSGNCPRIAVHAADRTGLVDVTPTCQRPLCQTYKWTSICGPLSPNRDSPSSSLPTSRLPPAHVSCPLAIWLFPQVVHLVSRAKPCVPDHRMDATRRQRARVIAHKDRRPCRAGASPSVPASHTRPRVAFIDCQPAPPTRREFDQPPCQPP